jgi:hypothetical protein
VVDNKLDIAQHGWRSFAGSDCPYQHGFRTPPTIAGSSVRQFTFVKLVCQLLRPRAFHVHTLEGIGISCPYRTPSHTSTRLDDLKGLFQAARVRGYRDTRTFMTMIYLIVRPTASTLKAT